MTALLAPRPTADDDFNGMFLEPLLVSCHSYDDMSVGLVG